MQFFTLQYVILWHLKFYGIFYGFYNNRRQWKNRSNFLSTFLRPVHEMIADVYDAILNVMRARTSFLALNEIMKDALFTASYSLSEALFYLLLLFHTEEEMKEIGKKDSLNSFSEIVYHYFKAHHHRFKWMLKVYLTHVFTKTSSIVVFSIPRAEVCRRLLN